MPDTPEQRFHRDAMAVALERWPSEPGEWEQRAVMMELARDVLGQLGPGAVADLGASCSALLHTIGHGVAAYIGAVCVAYTDRYQDAPPGRMARDAERLEEAYNAGDRERVAAILFEAITGRAP